MHAVPALAGDASALGRDARAEATLAAMTRIADLRKNYERGELDEAAARSEPFPQFEAWLQEALAAGVPEPTAMTLATAGTDGRPSTRVVLMKEATPKGIVWYVSRARSSALTAPKRTPISSRGRWRRASVHGRPSRVVRLPRAPCWWGAPRSSV